MRYIEPWSYPFNENDGALYGGMYDYKDAMRKDFCPNGWRLPTVEDFQVLSDELGEDAVGKLIMGGSSEFHVDIAGCYHPFDDFMDMNICTHFWTSTTNLYGVAHAWYYNPKQNINKAVMVGPHYRMYVRCIRK